MRRLFCTAAVLGIALTAAACPAGDQQVAEEIQYNLQSVLDHYSVGIKVQDGTAWLNGSVANERQMAKAVAVAYQTPGVQLVVNNLTLVSPQGATRGTAAGLRQPSNVATTIRGGIPPAGEESRPVQYQGTPGRRQGIMQATLELPDHAQQELRLAGPAPEMANQPMPMNASNRGGSYRQPMIRDYQPGNPECAEVEPSYAPSEPAYSQSNAGYSQGAMASGQRMSRPPRQSPPLALAAASPMNYRSASPNNSQGEMIGAPAPLPAASPLGPGQPAPYHYDSPNMPGYAWPSYAAYPNYAAVTYPKQYSPTAWPYIGPFYPYPQVPLGWRKVSLEWKDGWWFLDFKDSH